MNAMITNVLVKRSGWVIDNRKITYINGRRVCGNTLELEQNGRHFADDIYNYIFSKENICLLIQILLASVSKNPTDVKSVLVHVVAWRPTGGKPLHVDVIKWKHFPRYWPFLRAIHWSPVDSPHKGQWPGAFMFSLICAWTNGSAINRDASDLRRKRTHYDVTVMIRTNDDQRLLHHMVSLGHNYVLSYCTDLCIWIHTQMKYETRNVLFWWYIGQCGALDLREVIHVTLSVLGQGKRWEWWNVGSCQSDAVYDITGVILGLRPANERRRYFVTTSIIGWAQA